MEHEISSLAKLLNLRKVKDISRILVPSFLIPPVILIKYMQLSDNFAVHFQRRSEFTVVAVTSLHSKRKLLDVLNTNHLVPLYLCM